MDHSFYANHKIGDRYEMRNRDGSVVDCLLVYYPLDTPVPTALIEIKINNKSDFREIPIHFLNKKHG